MIANYYQQQRARERLGRFIQRWQYKPGWQLSILPASNSIGTIKIQLEYRAQDSTSKAPVPDTITISNTKEITVRQALSINEGALYGMIRNMYIEAEMHEMDEWLRFDGEHVVKPH